MRTAITLILVTMLLSCCVSNGSYVSCRKNIVTYGDAIECVVLLDEQLKRME
jgi:hypothetical protein